MSGKILKTSHLAEFQFFYFLLVMNNTNWRNINFVGLINSHYFFYLNVYEDIKALKRMLP